MILTTIIPIYNSSKYINRCLDSLIAAKKNFEIEIILVDDGSTDNSYEIIQDYNCKYDFIRSYTQVNQGVSSARNRGIAEANGEFVSFVDSDDFVDDTYFEIILKHISERYDIDIMIFGFNRSKNDRNIAFVFQETCLSEFEVYERLKYSYKHKDLFWFSWNKVYRRNLIKCISFDSNIYMGEDTIFNFEVFSQVKSKVLIIAPVLYNYVTHAESTIHTKYWPDFLNNCLHKFNARMAIVERIANKDKIIFYQELALYFVNHILFWLIRNTINNPNKEAVKSDFRTIRESDIYKFCFKYYKYDWKRPNLSSRVKLFEFAWYRSLYFIVCTFK